MRPRSAFALALAALLLPAAARAADPTYSTVKLPGAGGGQEPRIAVGRDDVRYAVTLGAARTGQHLGHPEIVYASRDGGLTWSPVPGVPPQQEASIDVDIITLPSGRLVTSELDYGGLNFPTGYSDDAGKTWTRSNGATMLADQDRQWFASGPLPKGAKPGDQPPVYLLYHNLASGSTQHNMFVATSQDGGATFGPPVPIAMPGSDAYTDLQCSDSGGPSNITVNPRTGRIYAFFTTRAAPTQFGFDAGGCGAPVFGQPIEFNIVNGTRVWVATSPDGSPGSWRDSLAVDRSTTGQVVSMQLAYGALDNAGNVYVAYPESPRPYPDLEGSGIKLTWQTPDADGVVTDDKWSAPATLVAPDPNPERQGRRRRPRPPRRGRPRPRGRGVLPGCADDREGDAVLRAHPAVLRRAVGDPARRRRPGLRRPGLQLVGQRHDGPLRRAPGRRSGRRGGGRLRRRGL